MNAGLSKEIDEIVEQLAPPPNSFGVLSTEEVRRLVSMAAERGAISGWIHGMRAAANAARKENEMLAQQLKELQIELSYTERVK
jgi:hypothetical protein